MYAVKFSKLMMKVNINFICTISSQMKGLTLTAHWVHLTEQNYINLGPYTKKDTHTHTHTHTHTLEKKNNNEDHRAKHARKYKCHYKKDILYRPRKN